jgi:cytochrome c oxidase subunit 2
MAFLTQLLHIDTNSMLVHQSTTQITGSDNQHAAEQRQIQPLAGDDRCSVRQAQQPVQRGQRQQHDCQYCVAPGCDQPSDLAYQQQIQQAGQTGYPASYCSHTSQPHAGSGPEHITVINKGDVSSDKTYQGCYRKVDQTGVYRMTKDTDFTVNGLCRHTKLRDELKQVKPKLLRSSLAAVCATALLAGCTGPFSSLDPKGPAATEVALLWWGMFGFATLILLLVAALWFYAIKRRSDSSPSIRPNAWLCWGGLALPLLSITLLLIIGIPVGQRMLPLPDENALKIEVTGHQWYWQIHYPAQGIELTDEVHIPVNTPVYLQLTSADVIHSFWVPKLGVKLDMLPGRSNTLRLEASEAGIYRGQCAEYCGLGHAHMQFSVIAHEQAAFAGWLKEHSADD